MKDKTIILTLVLANLLEANSAGQPGEVWSEADQKIIKDKLEYIMDNPTIVKYQYMKIHRKKYPNDKDYKAIPPTASKVSFNGFFNLGGDKKVTWGEQCKDNTIKKLSVTKCVHFV